MIYKMAVRNIFRQKRRSLFTAIGMILGMVLMAFSISLTEGTYGTIIDTFTKSSSGHIQIHKKGYLDNPSLYKVIKNPKETSLALLTEKDIISYSPRVYAGGLAFFNKKSAGVSLQGFDPNLEERVTGLNHKWLDGVNFTSRDERAVIISLHLSKLLKISKDDELVVVSQGLDGSIANDMYIVKGLVDAKKNGLNPNIVYMPIETLQEFLSMGDRVHEFAILLNDIEKSKKVSLRLSNKLGIKDQLEVSPWQIVLKDFYRAMEVDKKGNLITLMILIIVVSIGILNTVLMSVLERTREFGVLKAIGTTPQNIFKLIILENSILSIMSLAIGTLISIGLVYYFSVNEIKLAEPLNYGGLEFSGMKASLSFKGILVPAAVVYFSTLIVSFWPAVRAARILPIKAMSDH